MKHYGWNKVSVMGHSLGSLIGFMFAAIFPDDIDLLIGLDAVAPTFDLRGTYSTICDVGRNIDKYVFSDTCYTIHFVFYILITYSLFNSFYSRSKIHLHNSHN